VNNELSPNPQEGAPPLFSRNFDYLCAMNRVRPTRACDEMGISRAMAGHWRDGGEPSAKTLLLISEKFGVTVDALLKIDLAATPAVIVAPPETTGILEKNVAEKDCELSRRQAVIESQQRTIENLSESIADLTSRRDRIGKIQTPDD